MTKLNTSPEAVAKRLKLAVALKTNLAKRKALAKQRATLVQTEQNTASEKKFDTVAD